MFPKLQILAAAIAATSLPMFAQGQDAGARLQNLQREVDKVRKETPRELATPAQTNQASQPSNARDTLFVKAIKISGLTLITNEQAQKAIASFLNKDLSFDQIQEAGRTIAALYAPINRLASFDIPQQDVEDGVVEIKITEARLGAVKVDDDNLGNTQGPSQRARLNIQSAKSFVLKQNPEGEHVNVASIARANTLLNELPGVRAELSMVAGDADGTTDIKLKLQDGPILTGRLELSNFGSASTGIAQGSAGLNFNNPMGYGDLATLDVLASEGTQFSTIKYWVPVGFDGVRLGMGASHLNYSSLPGFSSTLSTGSGSVVGAYSSYAWIREMGSTHSLNLNLENKKYNNFTNGSPASQYQITNLTAGVSGALTGAGRSVNYSMNAVLGNLSIENPQQLSVDQQATAAQTQGKFGKLVFSGSYSSALPLEKTILQLSANGQLASKNLNSSEQLYLGGPSSVRAYPISQGGGSQGLVTSIEVVREITGNAQLGVFFDLGVIQQYKYNWSSTLQGSTGAGNVYTLRAGGVSGKFNWQGLQIQAVLAMRLGQNPLLNSQGLQLNTDNQYRSAQAWVKGSYFFN